ncbi:MAG: glutamate--tRNA ligase [Firmicutes bacterium]|jgi:glutamyl-tRNA synthetase|nr:glutamate--tRNA ligase [Bacillota bacterium]MDH7494608.1 glutamate--tRNA ligase [Bacillota bacterium]
MARVRVRFAPSPTGHLHVGGARTVLFNWLFARHHGGTFVLRIEDTDVERSTEASVEAIIDSIKWLGLDWDEGPIVGGRYGPYFQSERLETYREHAAKLLSKGLAYPCYCTAEELEEARKAMLDRGESVGYSGRCRNLSPEERRALEAKGRKPALRFRVDEGDTVVRDLIRGEVRFENKFIDDFVIMKSDGYPTYNFAAVVDDTLMEISHVIRGDEHLPNTPKQLMMYRALGFDPPEFAHVSMILGPDRTKLSKRHGATSIEQYREDGYLPDALVNYLVLLGWAYDATQQIFSREELVEKFSLDKVSKNPAVFDPDKLLWMNGYYLRATDVGTLAKLAVEYLARAGLIPADPDEREMARVERIVGLLRERMHTLRDVVALGSFFFTEGVSYEAEAFEKFLAKDYVPETLSEVRQRLGSLGEFTAAEVERVLRGYAAEVGRKAGDVIHPVRVAVTGRAASPGLFEVLELLGKDVTCSRLESAIARLSAGA